MISVVRSICQMLEQEESLVLATIILAKGSTPRTAGAKMVVDQHGKSIGTIGGGIVEAKVMDEAALVFASGKSRLRSFDLTGEEAITMDLICGGHLEVLIELIRASDANIAVFQKWQEALEADLKCVVMAAFDSSMETIEQVSRCVITDSGVIHGDSACSPEVVERVRQECRKVRDPFVLQVDGTACVVEPNYCRGTVYVFGGGHVSLPTVHLASMVGFRVIVLDDREAFANKARFPDADEIRVLDSFEACLEGVKLGDHDYMVIITRGHTHDKVVLKQALETNATYIGMIGSKKKRDAIFQALREEGLTEQDLRRVHSPIGIAIGAETPEEIAVSIVSELIRVRSLQVGGR